MAPLCASKVIKIDGRSSIFPKQVSTLFDFGMSWSHLSAFGPTFFRKCHTSQRPGLLFPKNVIFRHTSLLWSALGLGCSGLLWAALGWLLAALGCSGLLWAARGCFQCSELLCVDLGFLGCSGLLWGALGCSGLLWHALGLVAALGCSGLLWAALGCSGLFWVALGFQTFWYGIIRNTQMLEGHFNIRVRMVVMARISINTRFLLRCRICVVVS